MTQALQLLTIIGVAVGLAWYGLYRDKREHPSEKSEDQKQLNLYRDVMREVAGSRR